MWKLLRLQNHTHQSSLINVLMCMSCCLCVCGEAGVAHYTQTINQSSTWYVQRSASSQLWLSINQCFDNMCAQGSVWKCWATLHYILKSLWGLRILRWYTASPAWGMLTFFVGLTSLQSLYYPSPVCLKITQKKRKSNITCKSQTWNINWHYASDLHHVDNVSCISCFSAEGYLSVCQWSR